MKLHEVPKGLTRTFTGRLMNVMRPEPEMIDIEDIAHALSQIPRWGGHAKQFYSVAQHCVFVSRLADDELRLSALLHDASEAYLMDVPSPIKAMMPQYKSMEAKLMKVIFRKYNIPYPMPDLVKHYDEVALQYEWYNLVVGDPQPDYPLLRPEDAKRVFLEEYDRVTGLAVPGDERRTLTIVK